jgi:hypothetical protein
MGDGVAFLKTIYINSTVDKSQNDPAMLMLGHLSVKVNVVLQSKPQRDRGD